jgi:hypothetical protein
MVHPIHHAKDPDSKEYIVEGHDLFDLLYPSMIIKLAREHLPGDEYTNPKEKIYGENCFLHAASEEFWVHEQNGHKLDNP